MPDISNPVNVDIQDIPTQTAVMPPAEVKPAFELPPSPPITTIIPSPPHQKIPTLWIVGCITFFLVCAATYGLATKTHIFGSSTYSESNFASGILDKISSINSASYAFSASLNVVPRDADAMPFVMPGGNNEDMREKYSSDVRRLAQARLIIQELQKDSTLPETLKERFPDINDEAAFSIINIIDPTTQKEYEYTLAEDKKDFNLAITFETNEILEVIKKIQKSGFSPNPEPPVIEGKKVTFTKKSELYGIIDTELPTPFISQISDYMSMLPVDTKGKITVTTSSELKPGALADWTINIDAEGGMSDMTYKLNIDALKKSDDYFVKINNFPALFFLDQFGIVKNKWIIIPAGTTKKPGESTTSTEVSGGIEGTDNMAEDVVQNFEKTYKENRELIFEMIKKVATAADKEKILVFKNKPKKEVIDGKELTRYEISIQKNKLYSFVMSLRENITKDPKFIEAFESSFGIPKSPTGTPEEKADNKKEIEDYFKSEEFNQIFDYIEKNNNLIVWTDSAGMPMRIQNTSRIVPPDTAEALKEKQVSLVYELMLSSINMPIVITAPTDTISWDTISKGLNPYQDKVEETYIIAGLSSINTVALSTYATEKSYGKKGFVLGPCAPKEDTLFANEYIVDELNTITNNTPSLATCASRGRTGRVGLWALSVPITSKPGYSYCIDSSTLSGNGSLVGPKIIAGNLKSLTCGKEVVPTETPIE